MTGNVHLRDVTLDDLPIFFEHQLDPVATEMAGFPSRDRDAFTAHWRRIFADESVINRTIVVDGQVAGHIGSWEQDGVRLVGYWLGRDYWGHGVATAALTEFVAQVAMRPLYAHVVKGNVASRRVLEKCGFRIVGEDADELIVVLGGED